MTEFTDLLRQFESDQEAPSEEQPKVPILVIDDDESIRRGLSRVFFHQYHVLTAESGKKGVEALSDDVHCVILDVKMKELNGFSTYPKLKAKSPNVPIIFYTAFQSEHDLQDVINKYKPEGYVDKGQDITFLDNLIGNAVTKYQLILENEAYKQDLEKKVEERTAELKDAMEELKGAQVSLIQSEKMASVGRLAAGIAHEINNPAVAFKRGTDQLVAAINTYEVSRERIADILLDNDKSSSLRQMSVLAYERGLRENPPSTKELRGRARELEASLKSLGVTDLKLTARSLAQTGFTINDITAILVDESREHIQTLIEYLKDHYDIASIIHMMKISAERIITITESLRRYSHLDRNPQGEVDIKQGIEDTLTMLHNELKYGVEVVRDYGDVPLITCYPAELAQVWTNLIHNAIQAMGGKGKLKVSIYQKPEHVGVRITDSGPGIPNAILNRIFDPFFTTKDQGEGTGLGLSICYRIIDEHNGTIKAYSKPGKTTFEVLLPKRLNTNDAANQGSEHIG